MIHIPTQGIQVIMCTSTFFFMANFHPLATKKRASESKKRNFGIFFKSPYLEEEKLEVIKFRQRVIVGCPH
jgi:hypothetical protein